MAAMGSTKVGYTERLAGNLLRIARAQAGMTQRQLADVAGVPQSTIARIESGARQPSLPVLARILAAIDLEPRITLAPYDRNDDILDSTDGRFSEAQRAALRAAQDEFANRLRAG